MKREPIHKAVCSKCNAVQSVAVAGCSHASCGGIFVSQQPITELTATDWMRITLALKRKLKSPAVQGRDLSSLAGASAGNQAGDCRR